MVPAVRRITARDLPVSLEPLALVHVTAGELLLAGEAGTHRLLSGEVLAVRAPVRVELRAGRASGEALLFHAAPGWVERARSLAGSDARAPAQDEALVREAAGSEAARRAGRLLLATHLAAERAGAAALDDPGIERAGRFLELVGLARALRGSLLAPRPPAGAGNRSRRAPLARLLEELETAPLEGFTLGVLARRLGVSERHASRLLRQELGTSFPEYLSALRIERAKKMLATTDDAVTDVALETGWQSLSHFNAVFRRRVGETPSRYRAVACGLRETTVGS